MHTHTYLSQLFFKLSTKKIPFCFWSPKTRFSIEFIAFAMRCHIFRQAIVVVVVVCCFFLLACLGSSSKRSTFTLGWGYEEKARRNGIHICNSMKGTRRGHLEQSNSQSVKQFWLQKYKTNSHFTMDNWIAKKKWW